MTALEVAPNNTPDDEPQELSAVELDSTQLIREAFESIGFTVTEAGDYLEITSPQQPSETGTGNTTPPSDTAAMD